MRVSSIVVALVGASAANASVKYVNHQCVDVYRGAHYCFDADGVVCGAVEGACPTAGTKAQSRCLDFLESYNGDNCILPRDTVCQQIKGTWRCVLPAAPKAASHGYVSAPGTPAPQTANHGYVSAPGTPSPTNVGVAQHRTIQPSSDSSKDNDDSDEGSDEDDTSSDSDDTENNSTTAPSTTLESSVLGIPESHQITNSTTPSPATEAPSTEVPSTEAPVTEAPTTEAAVQQVNNKADNGSTSTTEGTSQAMVAVYAAGGIACVAAAMFIVHRRRSQGKSDDECLVTPAVPHPDIVPKEGSTTPTLMLSNEKIKVTNV